ncbi:enterochelin esterase-like enzyme [Duganella sp. 1224]|uniref:alpha/beta hydrolase n=1 Tax=Duganella sp. 1224 TaxID=2587052 RepID=UPI0015C80D56|nr:alpha/beta hydrolase-fold protein [Duganella sp. 1224]NYE60916.1 enterochelin esterase-like enzyme [Duganella sp. 1224]
MRIVAVTLLSLATLASPAWAQSKRIRACTAPDDPAPCMIEGAAPDRSQLPAAGPAAWISGDRLVLSWVGKAEDVWLGSGIALDGSLTRVTPDLFQTVIRYPKAQQTRVHVLFATKKEKDGASEFSKPIELVGPQAFAVPQGDSQPETMTFGPTLPQARVWLPPGYRAGVRYPILYLADGGWTSQGNTLAGAIGSGELAPLIVVGVDYAPEHQSDSDLRILTYLGESDVPGQLAPEFIAHERFLLETVIPAIERTYGAPAERGLRAVGGASNGGSWAASMALRNPGVFGTALVMSPGMPPVQHGAARSLSRFYVSAGDLEPAYRSNAQRITQDIVSRGGVATFTAYPSGHDWWMWTRILLDDTRAWLGPAR